MLKLLQSRNVVLQNGKYIKGVYLMIKFASRMDNLKGSAIREILKIATMPGMIPFAGGLPAPELFPVEEITQAAVAVLKENGTKALQYGETPGYEPLRVQIAERMLAKNNIKTDANHILITSGSQQGLDFSGRVFLNPDDVVIIESPSYLGAINAFKTSEPKFVSIPTDKDGMIMSELEKVLATNDRVRMIYVIPDFQNPSGRTWPLERRKAFIELINKYEVPVIEDNPYGELRYKGEYLPALKSMDTKGLVVYLGTFSKILAPGYRLGWVCASDEILAKYNFMAQAASLQPSTISAMEVSKFIDMFDLDAHVDRIREVYGHRCKFMVECMSKYFPEEAVFTDPDGGLFTWVELPDYIDTAEMAPKCLEKNVAYVPGIGFFPYGEKKNCMRLNYSCMQDERIEEGISILGGVMKDYLKK